MDHVNKFTAFSVLSVCLTLFPEAKWKTEA